MTPQKGIFASGFRLLAIAAASLTLAALLSGCACKPRYRAYQFDNGDDYFVEGLQRIVDNDGRIGFADRKGSVVIAPQFKFAFPFENGRSRATFEGMNVKEGEHSRWVSPRWLTIDRSGRVVDTWTGALERTLQAFVRDKNARIGVAVIINGQDTVQVNGNDDFPMMSVFKFPQALAVAEYCERNRLTPDDTIGIPADEIHENTWSPMRELYGSKPLRLTLRRLLAFSLQQSDNNACDVLIRLSGGTAAANALMKKLGFDHIRIAASEHEMHRDPTLWSMNSATPLEMAALFNAFFYGGMRHRNALTEEIAAMLADCHTGAARLAAPLTAPGTILCHKTGTGDTRADERLSAVNDAGYVVTPDGARYAIAVFVADSGYDPAETERLIATISRIVADFVIKNY